MTVLSEVTIRECLRAGQIIAHGDERNVSGVSYSCHAAKIFPGGTGDPEEKQSILVDWTDSATASVYRIQPRQLVWVRMRETVRLPPNICAFWWQTNTFIAQGSNVS
jgi:deoxycytidine triphosphate deaminase